jgi:hypothetical protein
LPLDMARMGREISAQHMVIAERLTGLGLS